MFAPLRTGIPIRFYAKHAGYGQGFCDFLPYERRRGAVGRIFREDFLFKLLYKMNKSALSPSWQTVCIKKANRSVEE
jgi:hypothetical protein